MRKVTKRVIIASVVLLGCASFVAFFAPHYPAQATSPISYSSTSSTSSAPQGYVDLTQAAESAVHSVVHVKVVTLSKTRTVVTQDPFFGFFGDIFGRGGNGLQQREVQVPQRSSAGSGVIISSDGYIVTNNHVVSDADEISVKLNDNREFKARVIGADPNTDLALLKIEDSDLPAIPIGNSDNLKLGEWVLAVGNPFNLTSTVTAGIVSAKARSLGANIVESFIQTDAAINQGNSGGALVNARGELVGINAMLYSQTGSYSGYGFAIPTTIMNKVVSDLKQYGIVRRVQIGIKANDVGTHLEKLKAEGKEVDLGTVDGVYVYEVKEGSSANDAGIEKDDIIVAIDGKKITKYSELQEALALHSPGEQLSLTYLRNKKSYTKTITLKNEKENTRLVDVLGAVFKPITEQTKKQLNISYGLEVVSVKEGKFKKENIQKGFIIIKINNRPITSQEDLENVVKTASNSEDPTLWISGIDTLGRVRRIAIYMGE